MGDTEAAWQEEAVRAATVVLTGAVVLGRVEAATQVVVTLGTVAAEGLRGEGVPEAARVAGVEAREARRVRRGTARAECRSLKSAARSRSSLSFR